MQDQIERFDAAIRTLIRVFKVSEKRLPQLAGDFPRNTLDLEIVSYLDRFPASRAKDIGDQLSLKPTTIQSSIDRLSKRGLVLRDESSQKGRAVALSLSVEGRALLKSVRAQNYSNCVEMLSVLSETERAEFVDYMHRIASQIDSQN